MQSQKFFQVCLRYSWEELTDLLYRRYVDPRQILEMDAADGVALLAFALQQEEDRLLFARWIQGAHNVMSFDEYKSALEQKRKPPKTEEEILDDVGNILTSFEKGR